MDSGLLHEGEGAWFDTLISGVTAADLQRDGYLSPLAGVRSASEIDTRAVHSRAGDFIASELDQVATEDQCVAGVATEIVRHAAAQSRRKILVFAVSVAHAEALAEALEKLGMPSRAVHGKLQAQAVDAAVSWFEEQDCGESRALVNCQILTTGYDFPAIDCIACARPTQSKALWTQIVGRGLRKHEGKDFCLILDFGGNIQRHGALDGMPAWNIQDEFLDIENAKRRDKADKDATKILTLPEGEFKLYEGDINVKDISVEEFRVFDISIIVQKNKKNPAISQLMVAYILDNGSRINLWLFPEHPGMARHSSSAWFKRRGLAMHHNAQACAVVARNAPLPSSISARREGDFWRIVCEHFDASD
jgi:DNA repair protein RadD